MADIEYNYADDEDEVEEEPKQNFREKLGRAYGRAKEVAGKVGKGVSRGYETAKKVGGHIQRGARTLSKESVKVAHKINKGAKAYRKFAKPRYEALKKSKVANPLDFGVGFGDLSDLTTPNISFMQPKQKISKRAVRSNPFALNVFGQIEMRRRK